MVAREHLSYDAGRLVLLCDGLVDTCERHSGDLARVTLGEEDADCHWMRMLKKSHAAKRQSGLGLDSTACRE